MTKVEKALGIENLYAPENGQLVNHLIQALKAKALYQRDDEYVVVDGEVKIVDEFTGRIMEGRRWSEGLHQAVEAKENVKIQEENVTVATVTIQNYFRMYEKLAGMTGTAAHRGQRVPRDLHARGGADPDQPADGARRPERPHLQDRRTRSSRPWSRTSSSATSKGQPVLVGTISVEVSEHLSDAARAAAASRTRC